MIDSHCHLNFNAFESDVEQVIKNAKKAGITVIINTGTQLSSSNWAVELAHTYNNLFAVVGIHPHHADKIQLNNAQLTETEPWIEELKKIAQDPKVIGIGECGLDYYNYQSNGIVDPEVQKAVFIKQVELAHTLRLPLQIHTRDEKARVEALQILQERKKWLQRVPGMFHCMAGSLESLEKALGLGFFIGFDGNVMYEDVPPGEPLPLSELVKHTPLDRIVIESDSPYLSPNPYRGKRNEPQYAIITAQFIADLKGVSLEQLVEQTNKNVYTIFRKLKA